MINGFKILLKIISANNEDVVQVNCESTKKTSKFMKSFIESNQEALEKAAELRKNAQEMSNSKILCNEDGVCNINLEEKS